LLCSIEPGLGPVLVLEKHLAVIFAVYDRLRTVNARSAIRDRPVTDIAVVAMLKEPGRKRGSQAKLDV
jgi:hypothetical protein